MKQLITLILTIAYFGINAQIFINTNPKTEISKTPTEVKDPVRVEVETTPVQTTTPTLSAPSLTTPTVTSPTITSPTLTTPTLTAPTLTSPTVTTPTVTSPTLTTPTLTSPTTTTTTTTTAATTNYPKDMNSGAALEDVPPNAEPGKCYARCLIPDQYGYVTEQVIDQPKMTKKMKLPALYMTVYDTIVIRPKSTKVIRVAAEYEYITEQVMVSPATTKWVKGKADAGCLSADPSDCQVMCLVEVPASYKTVQRKVMKNEAYDRTVTTPMEYKIVAKEIQTAPASYVDVSTPATYKNVQKRVLVEKGGYQVWREILCANDLTSAKISQIQKALQAAGYNPGPIDNVFGAQTKAALVSYQKAKGLPVGNLNFETLQSLGVN